MNTYSKGVCNVKLKIRINKVIWTILAWFVVPMEYIKEHYLYDYGNKHWFVRLYDNYIFELNILYIHWMLWKLEEKKEV